MLWAKRKDVFNFRDFYVEFTYLEVYCELRYYVYSCYELMKKEKKTL